MAEYTFVTIWRIAAPRSEVYRAIRESLHWPSWWRGVVSVVELDSGDANGIGSVRRYTWKSLLPYRISFDMRVTRIEPLVALEGVATGEVEGTGRWSFTDQGSVTTIRYEWQIRTTRRWMNLAAPLARPLFQWNHDAVMRQGGQGLARLLGARLVGMAHL
jgi:uncharacterized protein YndB with AHSA1/START domain